MEHRLYMTELFELYGSFLTKKQRDCLRLSLLEDFSLREIGEEMGLSRQSVYDAIHRGEQTLERYERELCIERKNRRARTITEKFCDVLKDIRDAESRDKLAAVQRDMVAWCGDEVRSETEGCL